MEIEVKIHGERITMIIFANSIAIMVERVQEFKRIMEKMYEVVGNEHNMRINQLK